MPALLQVLFDYYLDPSRAPEEDFIAASLAASNQVQQEDIGLCESVQRGLASPAYDVGRYDAVRSMRCGACKAAPDDLRCFLGPV